MNACCEIEVKLHELGGPGASRTWLFWPRNWAWTAKGIGSLQDRIAWTAHASLMRIPRKDWHNGAATFDAQRVKRLQTAMGAWISARSLTRAAFEKQLLGGSASDTAVDSLRAAAEAVRTATTHQDLGEAAAHLASAMQDIGLNRWSGFLRDAADQADAYTPLAGDRVYAQLATNTATDASSGDNTADASGQSDYVASNPEQWAGRPSVGTGECVPLVQQATGAPRSTQWRPGEQVQGNADISRGAAIATFDSNGHYTGHAAIYLGQDSNGIQVIDQWNNRDSSGRITSQQGPHQRTIRFGNVGGSVVNQGERYHVVQ